MVYKTKLMVGVPSISRIAIRSLELDNPFSRIAIRSLELDNSFSRIAIRSEMSEM